MKSLVRFSLVLVLALGLTMGLFANGLNLNGFGARATAMGGAYVSLAKDYTAVFWNPAGLAYIEQPTFGLAGDLLFPSATYGMGSFSMATTGKYYPAGLLGFFMPISDKIVIGLGAYSLSGLGAEWDNPGLEAAMLGAGFPLGYVSNPPIEAYDWRSFIGSITIAPSIAIKVSDAFSLGATVNINYGFFETEQWAEFSVLALGPPSILFNNGQASLDVKGWGYGATIGVMYQSDMINFGVTYRLESKIQMSGTSTIQNLPLINPAIPDFSPAELEAISPQWLGLGVSVKPTANLTLAVDAHYTNWAKLDVLTIHLTDPVWNSSLKITETELELMWSDKWQFRGGIEYTMGKFSFRGGYYYDPAPAPDETLNILVPSFTFNSIAGGIGYKSGQFTFDFGLEYLMGQDRNVTEGAMPGNYTMNIVVPVFALSYAF